jgi:hypothetical protein
MHTVKRRRRRRRRRRRNVVEMLRLQQACGSTAILSSLLDAPTAITYTVHKLSSKRRKR